MIKMKKIPMRTCVVTKEKCPKGELVRVVRTPEGEIIIDEKGKANGRGAYLKKDIEVVKKAKASKILNRHLEVEVPNEIFEKLENMIKGEEN
ncbi:MAG: YlxR family protein [Bacilli bacterium]|nr:YlxR family protein [Bacilli bacterium]